jgi:type III restriction enzyme
LKPQKRRRNAHQPGFVFDSGHRLSTEEQEYNPTPIINEIRRYVEGYRYLPNSDQWQVSPAGPRTDSRLTLQLGAKRSGKYIASLLSG